MGKTMDLAQLADKAGTVKTVFDDNQIAHNEVHGFDAQVNSLASTLDVSVENNAKETATALAIALGG